MCPYHLSNKSSLTVGGVWRGTDMFQHTVFFFNIMGLYVIQMLKTDSTASFLACWWGYWGCLTLDMEGGPFALEIWLIFFPRIWWIEAQIAVDLEISIKGGDFEVFKLMILWISHWNAIELIIHFISFFSFFYKNQ